MLFLTLLSLFTAVLAQSNCAYGPDTCVQGYVWREAYPNDHVCVTPATRTLAAADNAAASERVSPTGGPYGPNTCLDGYVWRQADSTDYVCVTPETRTETAYDNSQAEYRVQCNCGTGYTECIQEWFGTAPFCNGGCPDGWEYVRSASTGNSCDQSQKGYCVDCVGASGNTCVFGSKTLCQQCYGVVTERL